jgi:DNA-binding NarL/FixJ family response regulator
VIERIRAVNPGVPVIILSGQEKGEVVFELARKGISAYVIKDASQIENLVCQVTDILRKDND